VVVSLPESPANPHFFLRLRLTLRTIPRYLAQPRLWPKRPAGWPAKLIDCPTADHLKPSRPREVNLLRHFEELTLHVNNLNPQETFCLSKDWFRFEFANRFNIDSLFCNKSSIILYARVFFRLFIRKYVNFFFLL